LIVHVDDIVVAHEFEDTVISIKTELKSIWELTDLGIINSYLGLEINNTAQGVFMHQSSYITEVLAKYEDHKLGLKSIPLSTSITYRQTLCTSCRQSCIH
jgi:hypothetical protein